MIYIAVGIEDCGAGWSIIALKFDEFELENTGKQDPPTSPYPRRPPPHPAPSIYRYSENVKFGPCAVGETTTYLCFIVWLPFHNKL